MHRSNTTLVNGESAVYSVLLDDIHVDYDCCYSVTDSFNGFSFNGTVGRDGFTVDEKGNGEGNVYSKVDSYTIVMDDGHVSHILIDLV
jgi:hypothetical protein